MVQVIPQMDRGGDLAQSLGSGASNALQMMLQSKIQGMQQEQKLKQLQSILGGSPSGEVVDEVDVSQRSPTGEISNEQILMASQIDPNLARILQSQKESGERGVASKFKETKEERKAIIKAAQDARDNDMRLERMTSLQEKGNLINPVYNETLKKLGLDISALKNPDSQEFEKISNDFIKGAKSVYGSRLTNFEVEQYLKTIPTLSQSPEGKKRVIRNLKLFNEGAKLRLDEMKKVIKENRGVPPYNLEEIVEERVSPRLDKIADKFRGGLEGEVMASIDIKPAKKGESLTEDVAIEILKKAKGNKDLARKIAKKYGYKF